MSLKETVFTIILFVVVLAAWIELTEKMIVIFNLK